MQAMTAMRTAAALLLLARLGTAHDGHGDPAHAGGLWHWLLEPAHLPLSLGLLLLVVVLVEHLLQRRSRPAAERRRR